jgi:hypothetical protein
MSGDRGRLRGGYVRLYVGIQHQPLSFESLGGLRYETDIGRVVRVTLIDRQARVARRKAVFALIAAPSGS